MTCLRPAQDQARPHPSIAGGGAEEAPPLDEDLSTIKGRCRRKLFFSGCVALGGFPVFQWSIPYPRTYRHHYIDSVGYVQEKNKWNWEGDIEKTPGGTVGGSGRGGYAQNTWFACMKFSTNKF